MDLGVIFIVGALLVFAFPLALLNEKMKKGIVISSRLVLGKKTRRANGCESATRKCVWLFLSK